MHIRVICFTNNGYKIAEKIKSSLSDDIDIYCLKDNNGKLDLYSLTAEAFNDRIPLIFIGAIGIAVRAIAPLAKDKLKDSAVINIDDRGNYVIPILSGHIGSANSLALTIATILNAMPVITTSTDINNEFSVDLFAKENNLNILNRDGIAKVSSKAIEGKAITICIEDYPPDKEVDVLIVNNIDNEYKDKALISLTKKKYILGVGCKRGTDFEILESFVISFLEDADIDINEVYCIATIDIKKDEESLLRLRDKYRIPLITFSSELLQKAPGEFTSSDFVAKTVGVDNVCERAAILASGSKGKLLIKKTKGNGITLSLAVKE